MSIVTFTQNALLEEHIRPQWQGNFTTASWNKKNCAHATLRSQLPVNSNQKQLHTNGNSPKQTIFLHLRSNATFLFSSWTCNPCGWTQIFFQMFKTYFIALQKALPMLPNFRIADQVLSTVIWNSATVMKSIATNIHTQTDPLKLPVIRNTITYLQLRREVYKTIGLVWLCS